MIKMLKFGLIGALSGTLLFLTGLLYLLPIFPGRWLGGLVLLCLGAGFFFVGRSLLQRARLQRIPAEGPFPRSNPMPSTQPASPQSGTLPPLSDLSHSSNRRLQQLAALTGRPVPDTLQ